MERKECERVLTPHTPPLSTWQKQICILQRMRGFGYTQANRQVTKRQWTPSGSLWLCIAHLCSSSCCRM
uniref:Uncharacterized protein n=1 Tax=Phaseolus vulgaris TaxID=3885 RepID=V7CKD0_PHAVU|nr:hypothetical protein PHAVU_002G064200g [Phaseolus vulgaris]ESW29361.1 hypothetical protein PHAVU_002G064200g [Phaseolus vulgaris]